MPNRFQRLQLSNAKPRDFPLFQVKISPLLDQVNLSRYKHGPFLYAKKHPIHVFAKYELLLTKLLTKLHKNVERMLS